MRKKFIAFYILLIALFMPFVTVHADPVEDTPVVTSGETVEDLPSGDVAPDETVDEVNEDDKTVDEENNPTTGVFLDSVSVIFLLGICVILLHLVNKKLIFRV
jgi:hypothetical protein